MIGTVNRLIIEEKIPNCQCPNCNEPNSLLAKVYSRIFILKLLPFVYGKTTTVECLSCKKMYPVIYYLPDSIKEKAQDIQDWAKHKWFTYIGYGLIGLAFLIGIFKGPQH